MNPQGAGLGLTIGDKFVRMMKQDSDIGLQLQSEKDKGTKFWFEIDNMANQSYCDIPIEIAKPNEIN